MAFDQTQPSPYRASALASAKIQSGAAFSPCADETNCSLIAPAVETASGGHQGGGTILTPVGSALVEQYRGLEQDTAVAPVLPLGSILQSGARGRTGSCADER